MPFTWIDELVWREHPPYLGLPPQWHLRVGEMVETSEGPRPHVGSTLSMEQAIERGLDLKTLRNYFDAKLHAMVETTQRDHETLKAKHRVMKEKKDRLSARLDAIDMARQGVADLNAEIDRAVGDHDLDRSLGLIGE